ncbi:hypothetical protein [Streptomyces sp. NPDC053541]|uniref:hypothetical protein n=1 Tax=Streptomyces sp. NPDC053541 TaxID=3365709 RepID=UPI0037CF3ABE
MRYDSFLSAGPRCPRVLGDALCGLDRGHDGDHLPYVPGGYLPPPLLTPLDLLGLVRQARPACPLCGARVTSIWCDGPVVVYRELEDVGSTECEWSFGPCGCKGREIVTATHNSSAGP